MNIPIPYCGAVDSIAPLPPRYQTSGSSGADLYASEDAIIPAHGFATIATGLRVAIPQGYELQVRSRSGLACHYGIFALTGTIGGGVWLGSLLAKTLFRFIDRGKDAVRYRPLIVRTRYHMLRRVYLGGR